MTPAWAINSHADSNLMNMGESMFLGRDENLRGNRVGPPPRVRSKDLQLLSHEFQEPSDGHGLKGSLWGLRRIGSSLIEEAAWASAGPGTLNHRK